MGCSGILRLEASRIPFLTVAKLPRHVPAAQRAIGGAGPDSPAYSPTIPPAVAGRFVVGLSSACSCSRRSSSSLSFRSDESGPLSGVHSAGATVLRPFAVGWSAWRNRSATSTAGPTACSPRARTPRLCEELRELRQREIQSAFALQENVYLRELLKYIDGPRFPADFDPVAAEVVGRPDGAFTQAIVIAAGSENGIRINDPVVTADGLVGVVTRVTSGTARVQLLTDESCCVGDRSPDRCNRDRPSRSRNA